jgi:hypothetical protein
MEELDTICKELLEQAKFFYQRARVESNPEINKAYLNSALLLGYATLEAYINSIADDFFTREDLTILERSIFYEKEFKLDDGEFLLTGNLKMYRLEERIQFLHKKFSGKNIDKQAQWWIDLKAGINLRNKLTHPKEATQFDLTTLERCLLAIIDTIDQLFKAVYKKGYPLKGQGLDSNLA